jgi:hypothetical protein
VEIFGQGLPNPAPDRMDSASCSRVASVLLHRNALAAAAAAEGLCAGDTRACVPKSARALTAPQLFILHSPFRSTTVFFSFLLFICGRLMLRYLRMNSAVLSEERILQQLQALPLYWQMRYHYYSFRPSFSRPTASFF